MTYELLIARRYLQSKQRTGFLSVITVIAVGGVILGVAALIIMLSVTNGFSGEVKNRLIGMNAHISLVRFHGDAIEDYPELMEQARQEPEVVAVAPVIEAKLVIATNEGTDGVVVWGVDPASFATVSDLPRHLRYDEAQALHLDRGPEQKWPGIVLGTYLANRLGVGLGDQVYLVAVETKSLEEAVMGITPRFFPYVVTDLFESGMYHYDDNFAVVSLAEAQRIRGIGSGVTALHMRVADLDQAVAIRERLEERLGYPYRLTDWTQRFPELFHWMELEKVVIFIALSLIILVAAFNIMSILSMSILIKTPEIGILRAMGARAGGIRRIFVYQGLVIGVFGTGLGVLLGLAICLVQDRFQIIAIPSDIYIINSLPVDMQLLDFVLVTSVSLVICLLASLYPARKAAALQPVEAIRYIM
ncbi:MAG: ABC transporter permease [Gemmatimonadota bacterium]